MRKLTRGNPGCEFTAQQLLPGHARSARLPHGERKELWDLLCRRDGDEGALMSKPHKPAPRRSPQQRAHVAVHGEGFAWGIILKRLQQENAAQRRLLANSLCSQGHRSWEQRML